MSLTADNRPTLAPAVTATLRALRRRIRRYILLEGLGAAAVGLGAAFWATLAADWFFEPNAAARAVMLAAVGVALAAVLLRWFGRRALVRITDRNAAAILERRYPQLNDSLLTAVALTGRPADPLEVDPQMLAQTCREAAAGVARVDLRKVFNPQPLWRKAGAAGLLMLSVGGFAALHPEGFQVWARRVLTLSDELWPRRTRLEVLGFPNGMQKIARGADAEIVVRADARMPNVPNVVEVRYRTAGGRWGRETMTRRGVARGPEDRFQEYSHTFAGVLGDIHFDIVGGDDRVANRWIRVVDSPTISEMTLDCELPAYIGRRQTPLPVTGVMQIPSGSRIVVRASAANKELARVQVQTIAAQRSEPVRTLNRDDLDADGRGFSYALGTLTRDTTTAFTLTDADGITGRDPVRLALVALPDEPPQVAAQLDGIGSAVTPRARIPLVGRVADDHGLGRIWFELAVDAQPPAERTIRAFSDRPAECALDGAAVELGELSLKPGQRLSLAVQAADLCDLEGRPNQAAGERWTLEVVAPEQLRAMLDARELALRQRLERSIQELTETRDLLAKLDFAPTKSSASGSGGDAADSPERRRVLQLLGVQSALTNCRKSVPEMLGLAESFDDIRKQLVNNRIDTEELKSRLQTGIADPLRAVAERMLPELERRLESLQSALDDAVKGPGLRDLAQRQADDALLAMRKVLDRMIELEDFNEAVELLRSIIESQDALRVETLRQQKQKVRDLLKD